MRSSVTGEILSCFWAKALLFQHPGARFRRTCVRWCWLMTIFCLDFVYFRCWFCASWPISRSNSWLRLQTIAAEITLYSASFIGVCSAKVKKVSDLPEIDAWSDYVGKPLTTWPNLAYVECLAGEPIVVKALAGCTVAIRRSFLHESHSLLMSFLRVVKESAFMNSRLSSSLSCFSPDMLLLGDESYAVKLFRGLVAFYQECGRLTAIEAEGSCNEFKSFLVELRRRNRRIVSTIKDTFSFMRESEAFSCRDHLSRVVQLSSVLVVPREVSYPDVDISLSGVAVPSKILTSAILSVQSYVSFSGFSSGEWLTKDCLDDLKANLPAGKNLLMMLLSLRGLQCICIVAKSCTAVYVTVLMPIF